MLRVDYDLPMAGDEFWQRYCWACLRITAEAARFWEGTHAIGLRRWARISGARWVPGLGRGFERLIFREIPQIWSRPTLERQRLAGVGEPDRYRDKAHDWRVEEGEGRRLRVRPTASPRKGRSERSRNKVTNIDIVCGMQLAPHTCDSPLFEPQSRHFPN